MRLSTQTVELAPAILIVYGPNRGYIAAWSVLEEINMDHSFFAFFSCELFHLSGSGHCHLFPESSAFQQMGVIGGHNW